MHLTASEARLYCLGGEAAIIVFSNSAFQILSLELTIILNDEI